MGGVALLTEFVVAGTFGLGALLYVYDVVDSSGISPSFAAWFLASAYLYGWICNALAEQKLKNKKQTIENKILQSLGHGSGQDDRDLAKSYRQAKCPDLVPMRFAVYHDATSKVLARIEGHHSFIRLARTVLSASVLLTVGLIVKVVVAVLQEFLETPADYLVELTLFDLLYGVLAVVIARVCYFVWEERTELHVLTTVRAYLYDKQRTSILSPTHGSRCELD